MKTNDVQFLLNLLNNLEISLKNSTEQLKQISCIRKMNLLKRLQLKMNQSINLIEKLKFERPTFIN